MNNSISVSKKYIEILDQVFEIEKKLDSISEPNSIGRNVNRLKEYFEYLMPDGGLIYQNPIGESLTRLEPTSKQVLRVTPQRILWLQK